MKDSKEIVEPGDICGVTSFHLARINSGVAVEWTDNSFQYFTICDAEKVLNSYRMNRYDLDTIEGYFKEVWTARKSYIRGRWMNRRVVPITQDCLTEEELKYYNALMKIHGDTITN